MLNTFWPGCPRGSGQAPNARYSKYKSNLFELAKARDSKMKEKIESHKKTKGVEEFKECTFMLEILRNYQRSPRATSHTYFKKEPRYSSINK